MGAAAAWGAAAAAWRTADGLFADAIGNLRVGDRGRDLIR